MICGDSHGQQSAYRCCQNQRPVVLVSPPPQLRFGDCRNPRFITKAARKLAHACAQKVLVAGRVATQQVQLGQHAQYAMRRRARQFERARNLAGAGRAHAVQKSKDAEPALQRLQALRLGIETLRLLNTQDSISSAELVLTLGLSRAAAYRVINTLYSLGYVSRVALPRSNRYRLSVRARSLSDGFNGDRLLVDVARPMMLASTEQHG